jgi:hypothetical protein
MPELYLQSSMNIAIQENLTFRLVLKISTGHNIAVLLVLAQLMIISVMGACIIVAKYRKLRDKLERVKGEQAVERLLNPPLSRSSRASK